MRFEQLKDVFDHARAVHERIGNYYETMSSSSERDRIKMLLHYLARHEQQLQKQLAAYEQDAAEDILNTFIEYGPDEATLKPVTEMNIAPDATADEIIRFALEIDDCLIALYDEMSKRVIGVEAQIVLQNLLETEKSEKLRLARNALLLNDL